jgi:hypothetical protein
MKVILATDYGSHAAGQTIEAGANEARRLIFYGLARRADQDSAPETDQQTKEPTNGAR